MSILKQYESDFQGICDAVNKQCLHIPDYDGDKKQAEIKKVERMIDEARDLLDQMDLEVIELPGSERASAKARMSDRSRDIQEMERKVRRAAVAMSGSDVARNELFKFDGSTDDAKDALLGNTERLDRTSNRLDEGHKAALEAQEVGMGILGNLADQRETIQRSRNRLQEANNPLARSNRILGNMKMRAYQNKCMSAAIILIVLVTIVIIIILIITK